MRQNFGSKKVYQKPQVNQVKLLLKEAVLQNCKVYDAAGGGTGGNLCITTGGVCRQPGS